MQDNTMTSLPQGPVQRSVSLFLLLGLGGMALVWRLGGALTREGEGVAAALILFAIGVAVAAWLLLRHYPHDRLGLCNAVTLLRGALATSLAVPLLAGDVAAGPVLAWGVPMVALAALVLDGVDGWLARRSGLVSGFGARFDMEMDAFLAAMLALLVMQRGDVGAWVLVLGLARYGFVAAQLALSWLRAPLEDRYSRKVVCVVQIAVLIGLLVPPVVPPVATVAAAVASLLLVWSFAVDILWLARRR